MKLDAIILDIDGTLLNDERKISMRTRKALIDAQKKGVRVVLASGRPTSGMMHLVKELEMDQHHGLVISYNGACVIDCETNEVLFNQPLSIEEVKSVLRHLEKFDVVPMITKGEYMYVSNVYNCMLNLPAGEFNVVQYESRGGNYRLCEVENLADFIDVPLNKILIAGDPDYLLAHATAIAKPFLGELSSMFTAAFYYEFTAKDIDKAFALNTVLERYDIRPQNTIAFGDGHNDISIINFAGVGVAMANAVADLKAAADYVTDSNNEDGIAKVIESYI